MWEKVKDYLTKAGTTIFLASIVIWFLLNFGSTGMVTDVSQSFRGCHRTLDGTYYGSGGLGHWQLGVALISGISAKEVVVSSFCVLFGINSVNSAQGMQTLAANLAHGFAQKCVCHDAVLSAAHHLCGNHCNDPKGDLFHQMDGWRCDLSVGICLDRSHAVFPDQWTFIG